VLRFIAIERKLFSKSAQKKFCHPWQVVPGKHPDRFSRQISPAVGFVSLVIESSFANENSPMFFPAAGM
jgi:hypothetical protein